MTDRQTYKQIYWAWKSIKQRTKNPKCKAFKNYGARGISICSEWEKFEPFLDWALSNGWKQGLEIDRIDNNGNYSPDNCRWTTRKTNLNNRRTTIIVDVDGVDLSISDWADKTGIPHGSLKVWYETKGEEFVSQRIKDALVNGYKCKNYGRDNGKKIIFLDTGEHFESVAAASRSVGISKVTLYNAMKKDGATYKGKFKWEETI